MATDKCKMKYIIMCGGDYKQWEKPRQLSVINNETLVERTIRLLKENNIKDISISSNNPIFEQFNVPVLKHNNLYIANGIGNVQGDWFNAFYPTNEPTCYIFGDVYFSPEAIKKIVETDTDDIELFGSQPPFANNYMKTHEEPFALKVTNQKHLQEAIEKTRALDKEHKFWRKPIVWELFTIIKNAPLQKTMGQYTTDYVAINDYTCDIDKKEDINRLKIYIGGDMQRLIALNDFTLGLNSDYSFDRLYNIERKSPKQNDDNQIYEGDTFECDKEMIDYLTGNNSKKLIVAKIIEVKPVEEKKEIENGTIEHPYKSVLPKPIEKPKKTIKRKSKK